MLNHPASLSDMLFSLTAVFFSLVLLECYLAMKDETKSNQIKEEILKIIEKTNPDMMKKATDNKTLKAEEVSNSNDAAYMKENASSSLETSAHPVITVTKQQASSGSTASVSNHREAAELVLQREKEDKGEGVVPATSAEPPKPPPTFSERPPHFAPSTRKKKKSSS
jgi:hypothetical protein